jgi:phosphatidylglycerol---prolipoprotein diacylglyceryl transferase
MSYPYLSDVVRDFTGMSVPLPIPTFGLMVAIAVLTAITLLSRELVRLHSEGRIVLPLTGQKDKQGADVVAKQASDIANGVGISVMLTGIVGARLFHLLEYPREFLAHPWDMIFTRSGFTIYGGMIVGTLGGWLYIRRKQLSFINVLDAVAPAVMLAYAIGRIGCQISGDGDWGIAANVAAKPAWLPMWFWAQTYTNNIAMVPILAPGVYPTPMYETAMALICFAILWSVRKRSFKPGGLIALFVLLYGIERFLIELIRVNSKMTIFGIEATQAQVLSLLFIVAGAVGVARAMHRGKK